MGLELLARQLFNTVRSGSTQTPVGTLLGHFVTKPNRLRRYNSGGGAVGDGIHQYDSEEYLNSLGSFRSTIELHPRNHSVFSMRSVNSFLLFPEIIGTLCGTLSPRFVPFPAGG